MEYGFTGQPMDANGLAYHRARFYDPNLGVWISEDPLELMNRYGYVDGNPVNFADFNGMSPSCGISLSSENNCVRQCLANRNPSYTQNECEIICDVAVLEDLTEYLPQAAPNCNNKQYAESIIGLTEGLVYTAFEPENVIDFMIARHPNMGSIKSVGVIVGAEVAMNYFPLLISVSGGLKFAIMTEPGYQGCGIFVIGELGGGPLTVDPIQLAFGAVYSTSTVDNLEGITFEMSGELSGSTLGPGINGAIGFSNNPPDCDVTVTIGIGAVLYPSLSFTGAYTYGLISCHDIIETLVDFVNN